MKRSLNLISEQSRKRGQMRSCLRIWSRLLAVVMLLLVVVGFAQWRTCRQGQIKQASAEAEYEPTRQLKIENGRLKKQIKTIQEAERIPLELAKQRPLLGLIGLATRAVADQGGKVFLQQIEIERDPLPFHPSRQPTGQPTLTFALKGISVDRSAIAQLTDSLRNYGPFAAVEMSTNKNSDAEKQTQQAFSIQGTN